LNKSKLIYHEPESSSFGRENYLQVDDRTYFLFKKIMSSIIFRADGNSAIGLGHLVRSSALADMLKEDYHCVLATRCKIESLLKEVGTAFAEIISLPEVSYSEEAKAFDKISSSENLIVLDGYNFNNDYQQELFQKGYDIFSIDDIHTFPFYSKVIINHSGGFTPLHYHSLPSTQFYLGPRYALLRKPFLKAARNRRNSITDKNCFVCFGGADPNNQTMTILQKDTIRNRFENFHVVVGNAYQYKDELEKFAENEEKIVVHHAVSPSDMVSIMKQCSYAVCSPSTVVYEYLSVGGIVFLEQFADNQKDVINYFQKEGITFTPQQIGCLTDKNIESSFTKQSIYFDGESDQRFRKLFHQYFESKRLNIRKVSEQDIELCFHWANAAEVRAQSYNQSSISLQEHTAWFQNKLNDPYSYFYILELDREPVAQIRFQVLKNEAVLGYLAGNMIRSKGLGTTILSKGIEAFTKDYSEPVRIIGYVKKTNLPSQRSFERLAFMKEEAAAYQDSYKYTMYYGN
jgi:UDP-2,4-diacetamido-2,4,6-trideoxy-beta-L-altropyranose hydrolase